MTTLVCILTPLRSRGSDTRELGDRTIRLLNPPATLALADDRG